MKKIMYIFVFIISSFLCANVYSLENITLYSPNYLIYDMTYDEVVLSSNPENVTPIASLTKIMTTIVAIENINNMDQKITFTSEMKKGIDFDASLAGLIVGQEYTYRDLLYASMLPSGADATQALAYSLSGSVDNFVNLMNEKAKSLGMNSTNYVNVTGLDRDNHVSSINDVFTLLKYSLQNETFKTIYTTKSYELSNTLNKKDPNANPKLVESTIVNPSKKLGLDTSRIIGSKTGYTDNAGRCISFIFESNGHDYLAITTLAPYPYNTSYNINDALTIIKYIDDNYNNQILINKDKLIDEIDTNLATVDKVQIKAGKDILKYLPNDYDKNIINSTYDGVREVNFNIKEGTELGTVKYYYGTELLYEEKVTLNESLSFSYEKFFNRHKTVIIIMGISLLLLIILIIVLIKKRKKKK